MSCPDFVPDGQNAVVLHGKDNTLLPFRQQTSDLWVANRFACI